MVVIFDPEGVLTQTASCRFGAWKEMAREQGIVYNEAMDAQLQGMEPETRLQSILSRAHRGYSVAERLALLARQDDLFDDLLLKLGEGAMRPDALKMVKALHKQGIALGAVMTDGMPGRVLRGLPLWRYFAAISRKEEISAQLADVQLRLCVPPDQCLLVTAYPGSAKIARGVGMQALLCGREEENDVILQQIMAILPDFADQKYENGGFYAG